MNTRAKALLLFSLLLLCTVAGQTPPRKTKFEQKRAALLRRIQSIQRILTQNRHDKKVSTGQLAAINRQIEANTRLIQTIGQEIRTLNQAIQQKQHAIDTLGKDLAQLKKEYAAMVYLGTKTLQDIHTLMFIFAAPSFQALVQRLRYVKQYAQMRQQHFQEIDKVVRALQLFVAAG
ncbi:MAG: peptidase M23, partial [Bacteroidota bacterium]